MSAHQDDKTPRIVVGVDGSASAYGHGEFAEALLGSVSQHCVHHAPCPVVVIRGHVSV
jgi:nucleotide-binding universal stress UspA family protein